MQRFLASFLVFLLLLSSIVPMPAVSAAEETDSDDMQLTVDAEGDLEALAVTESLEDAFTDEALRAAIQSELEELGHSEWTSDALAEITEIKVREEGISSLNGIEHLVNLNELDLRDNEISDLTPLATLQNLTYLNLRENAVTDLSPLAGLTTLTEINLHSNQISDISPLADLVNMERLILRGNEIKDISVLANMPELRDANLRDNQIMDISPLSELTNLTERLNLDGNPDLTDFTPVAHYFHAIDDTDFSLQVDIPEADESLQELFEDENLLLAVQNELNNLGYEEYQEGILSEITKLEQRDAGISDLTGIEHLTKLEELDLRGNAVFDLSPLAEMQHLSYLNLRENRVTDISPLAGLTTLTEINLHSNQISDISPLADLVNMERLILRGNEIEDISVLANMTKLEDANLRDNQITDISPLANLTNLTERLNLDGNPDLTDFSPVAHYYHAIDDTDFPYHGDTDILVDPEVAEHFTDDALLEVIKGELAALGYTEVTEAALLDITELTGIRDAGITSLEGIQQLRNLEELEMRSNQISDLTPLANLSKLEVIDLRENNLTSLEGIENLTALEELDVRSNHIESLEPVRNLENLKEFDIRDNRVTNIEPITNLTALEELSARNNAISDLTALANLTNLVELNLHSNEVTDISPLHNLVNLERLILRRNQIEDISALENLLELRDINLRDNDITDLSPLRNHEKLTDRLNLDGNARLFDFSPIAHYYDDIADVDFVILGRTKIDLEQFDPATGEEREEHLVTSLTEQNEHITDEEVKESKFVQLASSPFAFFRGTAPLIFSDAKDEVLSLPQSWLEAENIETWVTGDLHVENLGFYGNKHGEAVFDLNDFDEVGIAPFYYDVLNFGTSLYLLNDAAPYLQLEEDEIKEMVQAFGDHYFEALEDVAKGKVDVNEHYFTAENIDGFVGGIASEVSDLPLNGELIAWTTMEESERIFDLTNNRLAEATDEEKEEIIENWETYLNSLESEVLEEYGEEYYTIKDIARRTNAGLGSLGYDRFYVLIEGLTASPDDDIILDIKAQGVSAVEAAGSFDGSNFATNAERTVTGMLALHNHPDNHWGRLETATNSYLVKERSPYKEEVKPVDFESEEDLADFIELAAEVLAYAHTRAAADLGNDTFATNLVNLANDELASFSSELQELSLLYYGQVMEDHQLFADLYAEGAFVEEEVSESPEDPIPGDDETPGDPEIPGDNDEDTEEPGIPGNADTSGDQEESGDVSETDDELEVPGEDSEAGDESEISEERVTSEKNGETPSESIKDESMTDENEREEDETIAAASEDEGESNELPQTATGIFNMLLAGILMFLTGGMMYRWNHRRQRV